MDTQNLINRVVSEVKSGLQGTTQASEVAGSSAATVLLYIRSVAGFDKLCQRLTARGDDVVLVLPKYGHYGVDSQRIKELGVQVVTIGDAWPSNASRFARLLLPGLHEIAVRERGGILDWALARARDQGAPAIALFDGVAAEPPPWLPAGVQWSPLVSFAAPEDQGLSAAKLAGMIDHTLLRGDATAAEIERLCLEAAQWKFASVCVNPVWVARAARHLRGTGVMVCTVIGFPLGATDSKTKAEETRQALAHGADEIDMVLNVGALKSKDYDAVARDIAGVVQAAAGKTVKVILETAHLTDEEKTIACLVSKEAGAHFVKTSTGFGAGGATVEDIALMRRLVGAGIGVKASGGIRDTATALQMVNAGASRIGASASVAIVEGTARAAGGTGY